MSCLRRRCLQRRFAADISVNTVKYPAAVAKRAAYKHARLARCSRESTLSCTKT